MTDTPRYAIYFAPDPQLAFWGFGSSVLGYDAATGDDLPFPGGLPLDRAAWHTLTADPRQYGFHATLKAPFHVKAGVHESDVLAALEAVARRHAPFVLGGLQVSLMGWFIALVPVAAPAALMALEADCVRGPDVLRAPLTDADRARRVSKPLSARQLEHLDRWGYPHVFDDFRFHMTLTGRVEPVEGEAITKQLAMLYAPIAAPVHVETIALFRQHNRLARFQLVQHVPLGAEA
jgi:putative phosphonate metabolism protein